MNYSSEFSKIPYNCHKRSNHQKRQWSELNRGGNCMHVWASSSQAPTSSTEQKLPMEYKGLPFAANNCAILRASRPL